MADTRAADERNSWKQSEESDVAQRERLQDLVQELGVDKREFVSAVRASIREYVTSQGADCLAIVERDENGGVRRTLTLGANLDYANHLLQFCRGKTIGGWSLDSGLTDPIISRVTTEYARFYERRADSITASLVAELQEDRIALASMVGTLTERVVPALVPEVKDRLVDLLVHQMNVAIHSSTVQGMVHVVSHSTAATTAAVTAKTLASLLLKSLTPQMKLLIIKHILSSVVVQKFVLIIVKKYVSAAVVATLAHVLAAKLHLSLGAAMAIILVPLIAAFITHEIRTFPQHLGEKIAENLCYELEGNFTAVSESILSKVYDEVLNGDYYEMIGAVAASNDIRQSTFALAKSIKRQYPMGLRVRWYCQELWFTLRHPVLAFGLNS